MITVRRSDTGTFVLVHEPSQMVVVGEDLEATYAQLEEHLREHPSPPGTSPPPAAAPSSRRAWLVGLGVLALLPFLWLSVLHYSLGRMIDELRTTGADPAASTSKEMEALQTSLHELEQTVERLQAEVGRVRAGESPGRRAKRAKRPIDASLAVDDDPDDDPEADERERQDAVDDPDHPAETKPRAKPETKTGMEIVP